MQQAKDLAAARKEQLTRGTDQRTPAPYKLEGKPAAPNDNNEAPIWDEV